MSEREHNYYVKIKQQRMSLEDRSLTILKLGTCNLLKPTFIIKRAKFSLNIGRQRRGIIKIQPFIHLKRWIEKIQFQVLIMKQNCHRL